MPIPRLRETRLAEGLSQQQLAAKIGTSQSAIQKLENGSEPSARTWERLLYVLPALARYTDQIRGEMPVAVTVRTK